MAIGAGSVWEYGTGGNNNNGGGYDSTIAGAGTDYSRQDSAQATFTDELAITAGSTTLTSTSAFFTSAMVGNAINIYETDSLGTNGFYFITGYTNTTTVTIDRAVSGSNNITTASGNVGGRLLVPTDTHLEAFVAGNKVWFAYGTYTITANVSISIGVGTNNNHVVHEGYYSTRGDSPTGANRPTINQTTYEYTLGTCTTVFNMIFSGSRNFALSTIVAPFEFINCKFENTYNASTAYCLIPTSTGGKYSGCEFRAQYGRAVAIASSGFNLFRRCYFHDSVTGIYTQSASQLMLLECVIDTCTNGILWSANSNPGSVIESSVFYACTTAVDSTGKYMRNASFTNNIFHGGSSNQTNCILDNDTNKSSSFRFNLFYNYTNNLYTGFGTLDSTNITGSDPVFTDAANGDFTLQSGSPALNAGASLTMAGLTGAYKWNIGVDQDDNAATASVESYAFWT